MNADEWTRRGELAMLGDELEGYQVQGSDGAIGRVEHVTYDKSCLVVHTGRLLGSNHVVPALAVRSINAGRKQVLLDLAADEVKGAPEYDSHRGYDEDCQSRAAAYYGPILVSREQAQDVGNTPRR